MPGLTGEFVISQRGKDTQLGVSPGFRLRLELLVVVFRVAAQGDIAVQDNRARLLGRNPGCEPLAHAWVCRLDICRVGEPLVAVSDEGDRVAHLRIAEPERGTRFAEQIAGGKSRCRLGAEKGREEGDCPKSGHPVNVTK
jgi:hypothetical protein